MLQHSARSFVLAWTTLSRRHWCQAAVTGTSGSAHAECCSIAISCASRNLSLYVMLGWIAVVAVQTPASMCFKDGFVSTPKLKTFAVFALQVAPSLHGRTATTPTSLPCSPSLALLSCWLWPRQWWSLPFPWSSAGTPTRLPGGATFC